MSKLVEDLAAAVLSQNLTVAVAESLTCGKLASALGAATAASEWFRGGVVAYAPGVKFSVLGVTEGPVVTDLCAREMAIGARSLLGSDVAVSVTGVGGPDDHEGKPAGTVFIAVATARGVSSREEHFAGDPAEVLSAAIDRAIEFAIRQVSGTVASR